MEKKARVNVKVTNCNISSQCAGAFMHVCVCVNAHVYAICGGTYNTCGGIENAYIIYIETSGGEISLERLILKFVSEKQYMNVWTEFKWLWTGPKGRSFQ